jgi:hypothetical protein
MTIDVIVWQDSKFTAQDAPKQRRNARFYVILVSPTTEQPSEFHIQEKLTTNQRENFRSLIYDDLPELLRPLDLRLVCR